MRVAVTDANIFIDIVYLGLTAELTGIGWYIHTSQEVFDELNEQQQLALSSWVASGAIYIHQFGPEEYEAIEQSKSSRKLSHNDYTVIYLAIKTASVVLSGDARLRKECEQKGLETHGIFWVMQVMVENKLMDKAVACQKLKELMDFNKRLPMEECNRLLQEWE